MQKVIPNLWFDDQAEEAANHYASVFENSHVGRIVRYGKAAAEVSGKPEGSAMTVDFEIEGQKFVGINGGPQFKFSEAVSFLVQCESQEEVDYYWEKLSEGGEEGPCGWLKDRYGLSWQVVPTELEEMLQEDDAEAVERAMAAMLQMRKLDIAALRKAYEGG